MKVKKIILLLTLVVLLAGVVTASELSNDTITTSTDITMQDSSVATDTMYETASEEKIETKKSIKEEKNIKTASKIYNIDSFNTLNDSITSSKYDTVTIIIQSDITLKDSMILNSAIKNLIIKGNSTKIDGDYNQFLIINSKQSVTIQNITITNCYGNSGSVILNERGSSNVTFINSNFTDNLSINEGGVIKINNNSKLIIKKCNFVENGASYGKYYNGKGGVIFGNNSNITIEDSNFTDNFAHEGGVLYSNVSSVIIKNSIFINNKAFSEGGVITTFTNLTLINNTFENNSANRGGVIYSLFGHIVNSNNLFRLNNATKGGVFYLNFVNMSISNTNMIKNNANDGSVIYGFSQNNIVINKSNFINNTGLLHGTIYFDQYNNLTIQNCSFFKNLARSGGAIYQNGGNQTVISSSFLENQATRYEIEEDSIIIKKINSDKEYGGAVVLSHVNATIINSIFTNNSAYLGGAICVSYNKANLKLSNSLFNCNYAINGGAIYNKGDMYVYKTQLINNSAELAGGIYDLGNNSVIDNCNFEKNIANEGAAIYLNPDQDYKSLEEIINYYTYYQYEDIDDNFSMIKNNTFIQNKANSVGKAIIDEGYAIIRNNTNENTSIYNSTIYTNSINVFILDNIFDESIKQTSIQVYPIMGIIGENITLKALVKDKNNKLVTNGYVIFKMNGITIKDNKKLTNSYNPLKVNVKNGIASTIITADLNMRYSQNMTAVYSGSSTYNASRSNTVKVQITQRNASLIVTSNVKTIKQGQILTITAKIYDTTKGKKSSTIIPYTDEFVYFKINGLTVKNILGSMLKVNVFDGTATIKYTIPLGLSGVTDGKTFTVKNHTILAGFYNKNYKENIRNTSTFQVERSNITITISNATVNNRTHKLSLTATIKDYLGNIVKGPNKCVIKINGISLKNGTEAMYYYSTDGILNIKNITIPAYNKYTNIEIVTQDRLAYKNQRNTTKVIKVVK